MEECILCKAHVGECCMGWGIRDGMLTLLPTPCRVPAWPHARVWPQPMQEPVPQVCLPHVHAEDMCACLLCAPAVCMWGVS